MPSFSDKSERTLVVLTFEGAKLLDVAGPLQVFVDARHHGGYAYQTAIVSMAAGAEMTDAGIALPCQSLDDWCGRPIDTLLIAGGPGARKAAANSTFLTAVRRLAGQSRRVGSVCTGAFVLAAAGLLEGREAVTHWESCQILAEEYPSVAVAPDRIFVRDGMVWTSAGVTAGIDMSLAMVAEDSGRKTALGLARSLVAFMARPGGQSQFSEALLRQTDDAAGRFDALHAWIAENLAEDLRVERLADRAGMSVRTFARTYQKLTGLTPAKAVERYRVEAARRRLEDTDEPIATVAKTTGFVDDERLRRAMRRVLGSSPTSYRERFGREAS